MSKAQQYLQLMGAKLERTGHGGLVVELSVCLDTQPSQSVRFWFPIKHLWNGGPGKLFAAEWIIESRNKELIAKGEQAKILVGPGFPKWPDS